MRSHNIRAEDPQNPGRVTPAVKTLAGPLAVLRELDRADSLRAASRVLGVPQPTLSRQLQRWQEELGIGLVQHEGRVLVLTDAGRLLAKAAAEAVDLVEDAVNQAVELHPATLRLGTLRSLSSIFVPGFAQRLADHDGRSLSVHEGSDSELLAALHHDHLDLVLTSPAPQDTTQFGWQELLDQEMVLTVPLSHRLAGMSTVDLRDVRDEPFLAMSPRYSTRSLVEELFQEWDIRPRVVLEGDDVRTLRHYVALGMGVSVLPYEGIPDERLEELRIVRRDGTLAQRTAGVAWRRRASMPPALRSAIELLGAY